MSSRKFVTHAFLGNQEVRAAQLREGGERPGTWLLRLLRKDALRAGIWQGPRPHVPKRGHFARIVVSMRPEDEAAARRRCGPGPLSAYLRGLILVGDKEPPTLEGTPVPTPKETVRSIASPQPPKPKLPSVEVKPTGSTPWTTIERLAYQHGREELWPPTHFALKVDDRFIEIVTYSIRSLTVGDTVRLVIGLEPRWGNHQGHDPSEIDRMLILLSARARTEAERRLVIEPLGADVPTAGRENAPTTTPDAVSDTDPTRLRVLVVLITRHA